MNVARHVIDTFFKDTLNPMVRHHLDSFSDFLDTRIPRYIQASNPIKLLLDDGRIVRVFIGGKDGTSVKYKIPVDEEGFAILPHMCRLANKTYKFDIIADITIEYEFSEKDIETKTFENIPFGSIPLMLKSPLCYLRPMTGEQLYDSGECKFELGGYFIIDGQERVLLTQESLGANMFYAKRRKILKVEKGVRSVTEADSESKIENTTAGEDYEYVAGVNSASEDGTRGPYSHIIIMPPKNAQPNDPKLIAKTTDLGTFSTGRLVTTKLPGFNQPVPLLSVFYALGFVNDQDIYDVTLYGIPFAERSQYDTLFLSILLSHDRFVSQEMNKEEDQTQDPNLLFLRREVRTRSNGSVYINLYSKLFPHCEVQEEESTSSFYRRKGYLLGKMLRMLMDVELGFKANTDRDHFRFKRLDVSGDLCFQEFRRIYNDVAKNMKLRLDERVEFEKANYKGRALTKLVQEENIRIYWKAYEFMNRFTKSFKGKWGDAEGVCQVLSRYSYLGTVSHLRRVNLMMDKGTKQLEPRRLHSSSWGFMCPIDNPDGHNVGMIKSLTLFSKVSTQSPSAELKKYIYTHSTFIRLALIHPSAWNSTWTKVYLNSDLLGVFTSGSETFHSKILDDRRSRKIDETVSLSWNRMENEYYIYADAGRIVRPVYREGIKPDSILNSKTWVQMTTKMMDYIDPQESETLKISMEPFHPSSPSEIHGTVILSASASVNPNSDHNQAPRNMFSCQQVKQACSWFNTAFNKRFDTIATHLHSPQRPFSQTWTVPHILGGGCLPYGENAIVAIAIFSGYNQDDSIVLNDNSLKRGMFMTSYYHSHDFSEEMLDPATQSHTIIANLVENSKYRETVSRKEGKDYSLLDGDGVIKVGSRITTDTILVGMVSPITNGLGQITTYRDISETPKRGEHGLVDAVHRYTTAEGIQGVKIRIVQMRSPTIGDKFSARHGQKGTCGYRIPEEDMPYTNSGLRPDLIINPHAFPSRMTIGQFVESMSAKVGTHVGTLMDSTAFTTQNRIGDMKEVLTQIGYHPYGNEIMYNGMTGEMIQSEIFMGPTYYLRLKHMVEDKINYRSEGPRTLLTHQPLEGRSNEGGLRIGEMERDSLVSHGVSNFLNESLTKRSDAHEYLFQPDTGLLDSNPDYPTTKVGIPYAMGLFIHEMESMHLSVRLSS